MEAIRANPDDDLPRLVFADWLDETGQSEEAEFIRLHCEKPGTELVLDYAPFRKEFHEKSITVVGYDRGFARNLIIHSPCSRLHMLWAYGFSCLAHVSGSAFKDNFDLSAADGQRRNRVMEWSLTLRDSKYVKIMYDTIKRYPDVEAMDMSDMAERYGSRLYIDIYCRSEANPHRQHEILTKLRSDIRLAYLRQEYIRYAESKGFRD